MGSFGRDAPHSGQNRSSAVSWYPQLVQNTVPPIARPESICVTGPSRKLFVRSDVRILIDVQASAGEDTPVGMLSAGMDTDFVKDIRNLDSGNKPVLRIIICSTRPGRVGLPVGNWFRDQAIAHGRFDVQVTDLKELDLPFMDEPNHPNMRKYTKQHTKDWSALVDGSDAFVIVMPEYNHTMTAPIVNAIDYLVQEWAYKPVGLVTYGGISGGLRAAQAIKPLLTGLRMTTVKEAVTVPSVSSLMDEQHRFQPTDSIIGSVKPMLDELVRQVPVLSQLRG